ncbi:uncharacterized protein LOC123296579 [Chrysoperla carnea]|uniref:uncharacterized protein LOC123296579 n=1 Tax=Chrysoperla carnea TaxID=189513 RepID=UPI001D06AD63|nr:uncharacterized protein LOC123296579 [Chrysoperla carnea]
MFKITVLFCFLLGYFGKFHVIECSTDSIPTEIFQTLNEYERGVFYRYFLKHVTDLLTYEIDDPTPKQLELFETIPDKIEFAGKLYTWILEQVADNLGTLIEHSRIQGVDIKPRIDKGPVKYICFENGVCVDIDTLPSTCCEFSAVDK